ncbi:nucleoside hydrolase [Maribellus maritimus]|uniref:nucleoside hydrolase n=1 Tax=Maribellus maritimus TaxID=2870838 RepID=UPI001EEC6666|nr:nucleoside hydrolase [Maribellus maritimus]MCG6187347.1 nucleoside hydrolase [Maribellus maritimus]
MKNHKFSNSENQFWLIILFCLCIVSKIHSQEPVKIIFDTDMASDCDDAGALAVLNALADLGEAEILAVVTNRKDAANSSAAAVSVINTYYGRPDIPIGTDKDGIYKMGNSSSFTLQLKNEFPNNADYDNEMPDALDIYRKILSLQPDSSVVICSVGALSNLEDLVRSKTDEYSSLDGLELIRKKVKKTIIMGGGFPRTQLPETNIRLDPSAAVTVTNEWPGEIIWQGVEVGWAIYTGMKLKQTSPRNPVRRAFELRPFRGQPAINQGKPSHDQAAILISVKDIDSIYWSVSPYGQVVIDSEGNTEWMQNNSKKHRFVSIKSHPCYLANIIEDLMSQPPHNY